MTDGMKGKLSGRLETCHGWCPVAMSRPSGNWLRAVFPPFLDRESLLPPLRYRYCVESRQRLLRDEALIKGERPMLAQNRICNPPSGTTEVLIPARNLAELLRDLGVVLSRRIHRGTGNDSAQLQLQSLGWESKLALGFVNLRPSVQLCAMIEDWPFHRIQEVIQAQQLDRLRPQEEYPRPVEPDRGTELEIYPEGGAELEKEPEQRTRLENKRTGFRRPGFLAFLAVCGFAIGLAGGIIGGLR
jgi:hypothetical protein